ncbi:MAG: hydrogenase iron-sulfur subunit [Candidatus Omnitrophica bacterium]|nr:hydrogenase iron-sulfur subunit [Candidatus Omnitrophota bacterium]
MSEFEPNIIGFFCNWCSYEAADAAGRAQKSYPANLKAVRLMCSGRIDPQFVLEAFKDGADGVLVLGCHPGDCHYKDGNNKALSRFKLLREVLISFGIEPQRFKLSWVSAAEADKFTAVVNEMVDSLKRLGPLHV